MTEPRNTATHIIYAGLTFSGNISFNKYKDRFRQILVLELEWDCFLWFFFFFLSSSFPLLLFLLFLLFFFSRFPSSLIVHPSLWRPLFPNKFLYFLSFLSYFLCLSFLLFPVNLCITSVSQILTWLYWLFFSRKEKFSLLYTNFFQGLLINHFFLTLKNPLIVTMHS